jgi:hypothetical protein
MAAGAAAEAFVLDARLAHIKGMLGVLQTVKQTKKQARACAAAAAVHDGSVAWRKV